MNKCFCGCGQLIVPKKWHTWSNRTSPVKYIHGHNRRGEKNTEESKKKLSRSRMGYPPTSGSFKNGESRFKFEAHYAWKGDGVGYRALHQWVEEVLGKPDSCEHCFIDGLSGRGIHWANKSGEYKRERSDWLRLCAKCHKKYDLNNSSPDRLFVKSKSYYGERRVI